MSDARVSVVMAVYNAGKRAVLDMTIQSIVEQTLQDWELLICDDGSADETPQWLAQWAKTEPRIRVMRNETNQKAAFSRNRCIREARGEFIAIMDADDACGPERLSVQLDFLRTHPQYAFVGLKGQMFHRTPGDMEKTYWFCPAPEPKDFLMTLPFVHASLMLRKEAIIAAGGYQTGRHTVRSEDYDLLMRMYTQGMRGANIDDALYFIREDEGTYQRRKYRYRFVEAWVKLRGFAQLGLMPRGIPYAVKPLVVGVVPIGLLEKLKHKYYGKEMKTCRKSRR